MTSITHPLTDEDFLRLDRLSSEVFLSHMPGESMARRYSGLMGKGNARRINVIKEGDVPVSNVNWYPVEAMIKDARITVGQIGGVCTHPSARGKGYADALLHHSFMQMKEEGIALCVISGDRGLYLRNGARHFTQEIPFSFDTPTKAGDISYFPPERLSEGSERLFRLHEKEPIRIVRTLARVKEELIAYGESHHGYRGHLFMTDAAYLVVSVSSGTSPRAEITEFCGTEEDVLPLLGAAAYTFHLPLSGHLCPWQEEAFSSLSQKPPKTPEMTAKIIDPVLLFRQLIPYFSGCGMGELSLTPQDGAFLVSGNGTSFLLSEEELFSAAFHGDARFGALFPLPLPDFHSMDYQ